MKEGNHKYLANHGLIKLIVIDALEGLQHPISYTNLVDMDRQAFIEAQEELNGLKTIIAKKRKGKTIVSPWKQKKKDNLEEEKKEISSTLVGLSTSTKLKVSKPIQKIVYVIGFRNS